MDTPSSKPLRLIFSPHLDDAVFSIGGMLATHASESVVVTVFAGTPTTPVSRHWDRVSGFTDSTEAMETRKQEDNNALTSLGIKSDNIIHWEYLDKQYRNDTKESLTVLKKEIEDQLQPLVLANIGKQLHIYIPFTGIHIDHRIVRDLITDVYMSKFESDPNITLYYYQDMPYTFRLYILRRIVFFFCSKKAILDTFTPPHCMRTDIPFDAIVQEQKIDTMKKYVSQFKSKFSDISFLIKTSKRFSALQALVLRSRYPFCEVVYRKKKSIASQE